MGHQSRPAPVQDARPPLVLGILGDSLAAGLGATCAAAAPTALLGQALADHFHRTVRVVNCSRVGSGGHDLAEQQERLLKSVERAGGRGLDLVVIVTGANDIAPIPYRTGSAARRSSSPPAPRWVR